MGLTKLLQYEIIYEHDFAAMWRYPHKMRGCKKC